MIQIKLKIDSAFWCLVVLLTFLFLSVLSNGQSISRQLISPAGTILIQPTTNISFVIGELLITPGLDSNGNSIGNSFFSSTTIGSQVSAVVEPPSSILIARLYPNPSGDFLFLDISFTKLDCISLEIIDSNGQTVIADECSAKKNPIKLNTADLCSGVYLVFFRDHKGSIIGSYKFLKA